MLLQPAVGTSLELTPNQKPPSSARLNTLKLRGVIGHKIVHAFLEALHALRPGLGGRLECDGRDLISVICFGDQSFLAGDWDVLFYGHLPDPRKIIWCCEHGTGFWVIIRWCPPAPS